MMFCPWQYSYNKHHPTEKPVTVLKQLIECFSRPGDLVLDAFAGSGSTLLAARSCGRDFLGIEVEPQHCATARTRFGESRELATTRRPANAAVERALRDFSAWSRRSVI